MLAKLLAIRNISPSSFDAYSSANMAHLSDPYALKGVREARDMIKASRGMTGAIIGDYDCDGVCSSAIASFLLEDMGIGNDLFLPHRMYHGYGLNDKTVAAFCEKHAGHPPEFVLVVDCGASSESAVVALRKFGCRRILIVDHHIIDPKTERVLGMGIVGVGAGEMIAEGVMAIEMGAIARDLELSIHPHPTLSETVMETAESFYGLSTHIYKPKK